MDSIIPIRALTSRAGARGGKGPGEWPVSPGLRLVTRQLSLEAAETGKPLPHRQVFSVLSTWQVSLSSWAIPQIILSSPHLHPPPLPCHKCGNQGLRNSVTFSWGGKMTRLLSQVQTQPLHSHESDILFHLALHKARL